MGKLVLIDGHSILNRAFYGVPELTNSKGLHTNAVYGFLNIMFRVIEDEGADYLAVAFDLKEPTFRHKMYAAYKGTRKPMPQELHEQVPVMKEVLTAMGVPILTKAGYEADDILGTIAKRCAAEGVEVSIVSGDRDLLQLASDRIMIRIPKTKRGGTEIENYHTQDVIDKYGLKPEQIIDMKGLMGDSADNIPGVPGIGEKTAVKILTAFPTVEAAYEHLEEVEPKRARELLRANPELAKLSKQLATIKTDCEIDVTLEDAKLGNLFTSEAFEWIKRLELKSLFSRFDSETVQSVVPDFDTSTKIECATSIELSTAAASSGSTLLMNLASILNVSFFLAQFSSARYIARGPRSLPPIPICTTVVNFSPAPFVISPACTLFAKSAILACCSV